MWIKSGLFRTCRHPVRASCQQQYQAVSCRNEQSPEIIWHHLSWSLLWSRHSKGRRGGGEVRRGEETERRRGGVRDRDTDIKKRWRLSELTETVWEHPDGRTDRRGAGLLGRRGSQVHRSSTKQQRPPVDKQGRNISALHAHGRTIHRRQARILRSLRAAEPANHRPVYWLYNQL